MWFQIQKKLFYRKNLQKIHTTYSKFYFDFRKILLSLQLNQTIRFAN